MGITLLAIGMSVPEMVSSIAVARQGLINYIIYNTISKKLMYYFNFRTRNYGFMYCTKFINI